MKKNVVADEGVGRKSVLLRARCKKELKSLAQKAAEILSLDESDVIRIGTQKYATSVVYRQRRVIRRLLFSFRHGVEARGYGDASDVMREGTIWHVQNEEQRLGLPPIEMSVRNSKGRKK